MWMSPLLLETRVGGRLLAEEAISRERRGVGRQTSTPSRVLSKGEDGECNKRDEEGGVPPHHV